MGRFPQPGDTGVVGRVGAAYQLGAHPVWLIYVLAYASEWATPDSWLVQSFAYPGAESGNPLRFVAVTNTGWTVGQKVTFDIYSDNGVNRAQNLQAI